MSIGKADDHTFLPMFGVFINKDLCRFKDQTSWHINKRHTIAVFRC